MCHPHQVRSNSSESDGKPLSNTPKGLLMSLWNWQRKCFVFFNQHKPSISYWKAEPGEVQDRCHAGIHTQLLFAQSSESSVFMVPAAALPLKAPGTPALTRTWGWLGWVGFSTQLFRQCYWHRSYSFHFQSLAQLGAQHIALLVLPACVQGVQLVLLCFCSSRAASKPSLLGCTPFILGSEVVLPWNTDPEVRLLAELLLHISDFAPPAQWQRCHRDLSGAELS